LQRSAFWSDDGVSDFAAKFIARVTPNIAMQQSPLCTTCREIPFEWLLGDVDRSYFLFENTQLLIDRQNNCELCGLILRSILAEIGPKDYEGNIILALSPRFLIIDGEYNFKRKFRVLLRLFADAGKQRPL
jgi:hypothetical protein